MKRQKGTTESTKNKSKGKSAYSDKVTEFDQSQKNHIEDTNSLFSKNVQFRTIAPNFNNRVSLISSSSNRTSNQQI